MGFGLIKTGMDSNGPMCKPAYKENGDPIV
jgi:hypothetical protein